MESVGAKGWSQCWASLSIGSHCSRTLCMKVNLRLSAVLFCLSPRHCFPASCPVLCSGNGQYMKGRCLCHSGWKGAECDVPTNQCIDISCNNHGTCIMGTCICNPGYKGESCEEGIYKEPSLVLFLPWRVGAQDWGDSWCSSTAGTYTLHSSYIAEGRPLKKNTHTLCPYSCWLSFLIPAIIG